MNTGQLTPRNQSFQILSRDFIKYIAMFTMLLNHTALILLTPGTMLREFLEDIGYFTGITMCYFLVEGYAYTRSKKKYALRLFLFAVISQIPFRYAFPDGGSFNMLFTLLICFLILFVRENIQNRPLRILVNFLLVLMTILCDWPLLAAVYTILFSICRDSRKKLLAAYTAAFFLFVVFMLVFTYAPVYPLSQAVIHSLFSGAALPVSGAVILFLYNGKRSAHGREFSKWFFYVFYPGHLLILGLIGHLT
jgi:hypothetical protein